MPRPCKRRRCRTFEGDRVFKPRSITLKGLSVARLDLSEMEAMRLCDLERHDQETAGRLMGVSRGTVQRFVKSGRAKLIRALLAPSALVIEEGAHHEDLYSDGR